MYGRLYGTTEGRNVVLNPVPSHSFLCNKNLLALSAPIMLMLSFLCD